MSELSPAAKKILRADAAERCLVEWSSVNDPPCHPSDEGWNGCGTCVNRAAIGATLEAVADQVVPDAPDPAAIMGPVFVAEVKKQLKIRSALLAIVNELKAHDSNA